MTSAGRQGSGSGRAATVLRSRSRLVLAVPAASAAAVRALRAPFPAAGEDPFLDLVRFHDPAIHAGVRAWYHAAPAAAALFRKRSTRRASNLSGSATIFLYRWLSAEPGVPSSNRFSVLDPARGYSRSRARARLCPVRSSRPHAGARTLPLGIRSWSLRSS